MNIDSGICRIIDANLNRLQEGLRVCEEYGRFVLENSAVCQRLKEARHSVIEAEKLLASAACISFIGFRDTAGDIGTVISTDSEKQRSSAEAVVRASIKRVEEALRVLEEYGKTVSIEAAGIFGRLRYNIYDVETLMLAESELRRRLEKARLYVLITGSLASCDALTAAREAVSGGADVIQMREKDMEDGDFYQQALMMRQIVGDNAIFLLNDRPHIAKLVRADGVHTGQGDLPVNLVRRIIGHDRIVGKSTSSPEAAATALRDGADYIGVGPVYPTQTKEHRKAVGLEYVTWAANNSHLPYFCIGSINRETLPAVLEAGASSVAVCTAIIGSKDIARETAWFKDQLGQAQGK